MIGVSCTGAPVVGGTRIASNKTQIINVNVEPTSTRRTADQVADAIARKQRIAAARNG
jgi:hypothetical protein